MSVTLGRDAQAAGVTPAFVIDRFPGFGLASVSAGECRRHAQELVRDPTEEDPHHALVNGGKPHSVRKALHRAALILIIPSSNQVD